jgi:hypothetical protein
MHDATATTGGAIDFAHSTSKSESQYGPLHERTAAGVDAVAAAKAAPVPAAVVDAVFAHIQAMRTLGHDTVNTHQIAKALTLTPAMVALALTELKDRGLTIKPR